MQNLNIQFFCNYLFKVIKNLLAQERMNMNKVSNKFDEVCTKAYVNAQVAAVMNKEKALTRNSKTLSWSWILTVSVLTVMSIGFMTVAFAADGADLGSAVNLGLGKVYNIFTAIVGAIAAVALAWQGFKFFVGNESTIEKTKRNVMYIFAAVFVICVAPRLIVAVKEMFTGISTETTLFK